MRPTTAIILDERTPVKSHGGKFSVKLRVTFKAGAKFKVVYYPLKIYLGKKEYTQIRKSPKDLYQKDYHDQIALIEQKAWRTANLKSVHDQKSFEAAYFGSIDNTIQAHFDRRISDLKESGRFGTANITKAALSSFTSFKKQTFIADIDSSWLTTYEEWMLEKGKSYTTIGINLRELRRVFNLAVKNGEFDPELYPFRHYQIKTESKIKIPVESEDVEKVKELHLDGADKEALAFWLFAYFCNGLNTGDILSLKWKQNVIGDYIVFNRQKTKRTSINKRDIEIFIRDEVRAIMDTYGNKDGVYVFPFYEGVKEQDKIEVKKRVGRRINRRLKSISDNAGLKVTLKLSIARHTFANALLNAGVTKEFIQYALGHTDGKTTEHYLSGFKRKIIKEVSRIL